jgi:two-component system NtrC family sensor kinase
MRRGPKPAKPKEAKPPVGRKSPKNGAARVSDLEKRLAEAHEREAEALRHEAEAREQQTATTEILRVIASSPTNVQPVFDAIAQSARRLLSGLSADVTQLISGELHLAAFTSVTDATDDALRAVFPSPLDRPGVHTAAARDKVPFIVIDSESDDRVGPRARDVFRARGYRAALAVPMLQYDGHVIGAIAVTRRNPGRFTDDEIALLQTFATQAVSAINNVRLFNETKEALEQQTATSEVLRVISQSPTDVQPVFDAVAASAARLCESFDANIFRRDRDRLVLVAHHGPIPAGPTIRSTGGPPAEDVNDVNSPPIQYRVGEFSLPLGRGAGAGRAVLDGCAVHVADMQTEVDEFPESSDNARRFGFRTILCVPFMREGLAIGVMVLLRTEARLFTDRQVALLQTFADQAVIAIENVRLFNETKEALEQQTATSEILRVISSSPTDVQPVFDAVLATRRARGSSLTRA